MKEVSTYMIHKAVDAAFECRGEHSCYSGADDMTQCTCLKQMQAAVLDNMKLTAAGGQL